MGQREFKLIASMTKDGVQYEADDVFVLESEVTNFVLGLNNQETFLIIPTQDTAQYVLYLSATLNEKAVDINNLQLQLSSASTTLQGLINTGGIRVALRSGR